MRIPKSRTSEVARSLQNATPTAERPVFLIMSLMKIPEVDQHKVAAKTSRMPESLVDIGFGFSYVVSAAVPQPDLFKEHGYHPLPNAPVARRAVYDCLCTEHAIMWSSHSIPQKYGKGKLSPKIVRAILLAKGNG